MRTPKAEKVIDGVKFRVALLSVADGRDAMVRLQRTFGPALGELIEGGLRGGTARAFASLADRLTLADFSWFCEKFGECSEATFTDEEGHECVLVVKDAKAQDRVFAGKYDLLLAWLELCLETNFQGFFEKLRTALTQALRSATSTPTPSQ